MVAAKSELPKALDDSKSAAPACILTINGPTSSFAFLISLGNSVCDVSNVLGTHLSED